MTDGHVVQLEVRIDARPDLVFRYLTEAERYARWQGVRAELDPRPGGIYRVNVTGRDIARGEYVEINPYSKVVFTWGWEGDNHPIPPGSSTVEVTFQPDGDGTLVRLRHYNLPTDEDRGRHAEGWDHYLPRLQAAATGTGAGPDPWTSPTAIP